MNIPPLDLKRQYAQIKNEVMTVINDVCESQHFILGKRVADFEARMAHYCGTKYAIGCANGTDAILLSLMVAGVGPGDEVLVPSFTFIASAEPIASLGAKPVFCEIDEKTYNIDPMVLGKKITKKTKAIMVVHLYGQTADMHPLLGLAKKHKLKVVEDACQAIGAVYGPLGKKAGAMGDLGCFSFFPSKNLGGFGDGGLIVTNNKRYVDQLLMLRQHGSRKRYYHDLLGMNSRLDVLQAAVLNIKLDYLDEWLKARVEKAALYDRLFKSVMGDRVIVPYTEKGNTHTYHQYVIRLSGVGRKTRDSIVEEMGKKGVGVNVYYPVPCHLQKCFTYLKYKKNSLPITEQAACSTLALPIYPELTKEEQEYVVKSIKECLETKG